MLGKACAPGKRPAWDDTPCHGDVLHITRQYECLANTLSCLAKGAQSRCEKLEAEIAGRGELGPDDERAVVLPWQTETEAQGLAHEIRTLAQWLSHDVLALDGPALATRQILFDFIVEELAKRELEDVRRIRPLRVALQNQRDDLYQQPLTSTHAAPSLPGRLLQASRPSAPRPTKRRWLGHA
jgi:hypothetical protein